MKNSEVFYEAACRFSNRESACKNHSCCAIDEVDAAKTPDYQYLMSRKNMNEFAQDVYDAADVVDWDAGDFRTFMLLMASEEAKLHE